MVEVGFELAWLGFPGKESACRCRRHRFDPWVGKIPWRREWQPTPVFLPEESHGQRSLVGYGPWGCKELDTTEQLPLFTLLVWFQSSGSQHGYLPLVQSTKLQSLAFKQTYWLISRVIFKITHTRTQFWPQSSRKQCSISFPWKLQKCVCVCVCMHARLVVSNSLGPQKSESESLSRVRLFATQWTVAY